MLTVDFLLMVNSIRGHILLIVCDIFLCKEAENCHFGRYSEAKPPFIRSRSSKAIDFVINRKRVYTFLLVINDNFSHILHRFEDMVA